MGHKLIESVEGSGVFCNCEFNYTVMFDLAIADHGGNAEVCDATGAAICSFAGSNNYQIIS